MQYGTSHMFLLWVEEIFFEEKYRSVVHISIAGGRIQLKFYT